MTGTDAKEHQVVVETISIPSCLQESEVYNHSTSNTEELKLRLSYQREIGFGQLFGFYQQNKPTESGLPLEKLILWNQEETQSTIPSVVKTHSAQPSIGDLPGISIDTQKLTKTTSTQLVLLMVSTLMDSTGMTNNCTHTLTAQSIKFWLLTSHRKVCGTSVNSLHHSVTHGKEEEIAHHLIRNFISL